MRAIRVLGVCMVAMLVAATVAATSASALPEWGQCYAMPATKYINSSCTEKAKKHLGAYQGSYEWRGDVPPMTKPFESASAANALILAATYSGSVAGVVEVRCTSESDEGELSGTKEVRTVIARFKGCEALPGSFTGSVKCENPAGNSGEVIFSTLEGKLGYIDKPDKEVGMLLTPESTSPFPRPIVEFECGAYTIVAGRGVPTATCAYAPDPKCGDDGVISAITPVNLMSHQFTELSVRAVANPFENAPSEFENTGTRRSLESRIFKTNLPSTTSDWAQAAEELTTVMEPKAPLEAWEIKA
jgi:hypothetical protein